MASRQKVLSKRMTQVLVGAWGAAAGCAAADQAVQAPRPNLLDPIIQESFFTPMGQLARDAAAAGPAEALLLSPPFACRSDQSWWELYIPTNYQQFGELGSKEEMRELAASCRLTGRLLGVELPLTWTAGRASDHASPGGLQPHTPPFSKGDLQGPEAFGWPIDYAHACCREKAHQIVEELYQMGVRVFRYDHARRIPPEAMREILLSQQESGDALQVLHLGGPRPSVMGYLSELQRQDVKTFDYGWMQRVATALAGDVQGLQTAHPLPFGQTVLPISTHDVFTEGVIEHGRAYDLPSMTFFALTAYSLPMQILDCSRSKGVNLSQADLHRSETLARLAPVVQRRAGWRRQPLHWLRTSAPRTAAAYQRGAERLFFLSTAFLPTWVVVEHELEPGQYRELLSGKVYDISRDPLVFAQQTQTFYALERVECSSEPLFSVPPVVHLIWVQGIDKAPQTAAVSSLAEAGCEVELWDQARFEAEILALLSDREALAYEKLKTLPVRGQRLRFMMLSDFMRLAILRARGGYYTDFDTVCHWPFQRHFQDYELVVSLQGNGQINNAFIGSARDSRPIHELLQELCNRVEACTGSRPVDVLSLTGPHLFTETIKTRLGTLVLDPNYFISYRFAVTDPSCYVSHYYASVVSDAPVLKDVRVAPEDGRLLFKAALEKHWGFNFRRWLAPAPWKARQNREALQHPRPGATWIR